MKKSLLMLLTAVCILLQPLSIGALAAEDDDVVSAQESAGAPPAVFDVYVQVDDYDSVLLASYTGTQMRTWARQKNPAGAKLKYSAQSYNGTAGRVVTEYITLSDFIDLVAQDVGSLCFDSGDYFIMGEDLTKDQELIDAGYSRAELMGNWYSYDAMIGTKRYYFPNWNSGSEEGAIEVPSVIGIKSYGDSSGMSDALLDIYTGSADYLWAYVVYFGQQKWTDLNYPYFYYQQSQATISYSGDTQANETVAALLGNEIARAQELLEDTETGTSSADVAQGKYWVTAGQYSVLQSRLSSAMATAEKEAVTNGEAYAAMLVLKDANDLFESQRKPGEKSGYFWYTDNDTDTYVITTANQLWELCWLVNGMAYDETTFVSYDQDSFEGKTIILGCDIDAEGMRPHIGDGNYAFEGTFDGCGHTISNLVVTFSGNTNYAALFGNIGESGVVRNLTVEGTAGGNNITSYVSGLAARSAGTIENCVSYMDVTAANASYVGGIAGYNTGTVSGCAFLGTVRGAGYVGGIVGCNDGTVKECVNAGMPSGSSAVGGITGYNSADVTYCIDTKCNLAGSNAGTLAYSYSIGGYAVEASTGTVSGVFCVGEDAGIDGVTALSGSADFRSPEVLNALNSTAECFQQVRAGYPALKWQTVYTVYYELMLDDNTMEESEAAEYLPVIRPDDPAAKKYDGGELIEDAAYRFAGWYANEAKTDAYDFTDAVTGDLTLYAKWTDESGEMIRKITVNIERHTVNGVGTDQMNYFYPEGGTYSIQNEEIEGFICQTPVLMGTVGTEDIEYTVIYRRLGDMNLDGVINPVDAMLLLRHLAGKSSLEAEPLMAADVNGDGFVNSDDCVGILRISIGLGVERE